jgi:hypothetical protein
MIVNKFKDVKVQYHSFDKKLLDRNLLEESTRLVNNTVEDIKKADQNKQHVNIINNSFLSYPAGLYMT